MPSPEWFFSTLSQSMAAIVGFIITIALVLHQLEKNERQRRTARLREELIKLEKKYGNALFSVMEALKQPFDGAVPPNEYNPDDDSIKEIKNMSDDELGNYPITNRVWMRSYYISKLLDDISASEDTEEHYLLNQNEIEELVNSASYISNRILGDNGTVASEIKDTDADEKGLSASTEIFDFDSIEYIDMDDWFTNYFEPYQGQKDLDGTDLMSLHNFYKEMHGDVRTVSRTSKNTILQNDHTISKLRIPILLIIITGVLLPLLSLLTLPGGGIVLPNRLLSIYQTSLLLLSGSIAIYTVFLLWTNV